MKRDLRGARIVILGGGGSLTRLVAALLDGAGSAPLVLDRASCSSTSIQQSQPDLVILECGPPHRQSLRECQALLSNAGLRVFTMVHGIDDGDVDTIGQYAALGTDYFLCYPCSPDEHGPCQSCLAKRLLPRLKLRLNRPPGTNGSGQIEGGGLMAIQGSSNGISHGHAVGNLTVDFRGHRVFKDGESLHLTPLEFGVLAHLVANAGRAVSREEFLSSVWGFEYVGGSNLVDVTIRGLRRKVETEPARPKLITTVRGVGYRLDDPFGSPVQTA